MPQPGFLSDAGAKLCEQAERVQDPAGGERVQILPSCVDPRSRGYLLDFRVASYFPHAFNSGCCDVFQLSFPCDVLFCAQSSLFMPGGQHTLWDIEDLVKIGKEHEGAALALTDCFCCVPVPMLKPFLSL